MTNVTFQHYLEQDRTWGPHFMPSVPHKDDVVHLEGEAWWVTRIHYKPETSEAIIIVTPYPKPDAKPERSTYV